MEMKKFGFKSLLLGCALVIFLAACSPNAAASQSAMGATAVPASVSSDNASAPVSNGGDPALLTDNSSAQSQAVSAKLNLNTATADEFLEIPGVGDRMVREFMEYRPYTSIAQFSREIGKYVSADQVSVYEQSVYVPVDLNAADADLGSGCKRSCRLDRRPALCQQRRFSQRAGPIRVWR